MKHIFEQLPSEVIAMYNIELVDENVLRIAHPFWTQVREENLSELEQIWVLDLSVTLRLKNMSISFSRNRTDAQIVIY